MDFSKIQEVFSRRFDNRLQSVDSHTAGERTRLIISGIDDIHGETMTEKLMYYKTHLDYRRKLLCREPRGDRATLAAQLTRPVTGDARFGLIYMDARRYPYLCGHATIGAVTTLIETGVIETGKSEETIVVDTPSGPMITRAEIRNGKVESVAIAMVPSFVYETECLLNVKGLGEIRVDTVCAGGFFAMVSSRWLEMELVPENASRLIELGMEIIEATNRELTVRHPTREEVVTVDVAEFYEPFEKGKKQGKSVVVYGESHMDRSPCGTGTSAKLTLFHRQGLLLTGETYKNAGPLDTTFDARVIRETKIGDLDGVEVEIRGAAYITGIHEYVVDAGDPLPEGYLL